jgi:glycosyltransferase involved in cell wall biosynthesis
VRILQVAPPWFAVPPERYGGTELVVAGLCDGLVAVGNEVTLVASGGSCTSAQLRSVYAQPPSEALGDAVVELPHVLAAYRDRHSFDLIHDHTVTGVGVGALIDGPPIVHTVHGTWTPQVCRLYRAVSDRVALVAISHDHAARAPTDLPLAGVVHNGIDVNRYPFQDRSEGYLAWLGRAGPDKGADLAVEVARQLDRPLRMAVKLNEPAEHDWWQRVLVPRLADVQVEVVHNATHAQKVALLGGADALVFPIRWDEPFGLAMIEANACGTPVVAFARGAASEVISDGQSGLLVTPGDVDGLCEATERAAGLDRHACRAHVVRHFTVAQMVAGYTRIYARLTASRAGPSTTVELDPRWVVEIVGDEPVRRRVDETLLTVADGRFGTRGTRDEDGPGYEPLVMAAGVYAPADGETQGPLPGPLWFAVELDPSDTAAERRWLNLREGVLYRQGAGSSQMRALRFASLARPGTLVSRVETAGGLGAGDPTVVSGVSPEQVEREVAEGAHVVKVTGQGGIVAAIATDLHTDKNRRVLDRIAVMGGAPHAPPSIGPVVEELTTARATGVDGLLVEQRQAWAARWRDAQVDIEGDPELELAVRFGLSHLISSVADRGEAAVGARGLSGSAYAGHVFWDADVFVLPFLAATHPPAARAMLDYRVRRLKAARARARQEGRSGARFPWESAADGNEATPRSMTALDGPSSRSAPASSRSTSSPTWRGPPTITPGGRAIGGSWPVPGRDLLVETARYWASRLEVDADGTAHVRGVMGPDEYHEDVDDNAYTNVMARWNLRRAADLLDPADPEAARWRDLADRLVDGYDPRHGLLRAVRRLLATRPLDLADAREPPIAADVLLGRDRVAATRFIKQADVLMLHHLVPEEVAPGSWHPTSTSTSRHRPRQLAVAGHARQPARPGRTSRGSRELAADGRHDRPRRRDGHHGRGGSTWPRWAGCGRRWRSGSSAHDPPDACCTSTHAHCPTAGRPCNSACGSTAGGSCCATTTTMWSSTPTVRSPSTWPTAGSGRTSDETDRSSARCGPGRSRCHARGRDDPAGRGRPGTGIRHQCPCNTRHDPRGRARPGHRRPGRHRVGHDPR